LGNKFLALWNHLHDPLPQQIVLIIFGPCPAKKLITKSQEA